MPAAKRPTLPRKFDDLLSRREAVTLLSLLPTGAPGLLGGDLDTELHCAHPDLKDEAFYSLIRICRDFGAEIRSDRRQADTKRGRGTRYWWMPTPHQLMQVSAADEMLPV